MQRTSKVSNFLKSKTFVLVILLIVEFAVYAILSEGLYISVINIKNILNAIVITAFLTVGAVLLMVRGYVDISSSQVGCLCVMMVAALLRDGFPWPIAILLCLIVGAVVGLVNAVLITECGFQPFIVTMAMSYVIKGATYLTCGTEPIPIHDKAMITLGTGKIANLIPYTLILALIAIVVYGFILKKTYFGKTIYMIGGNAQAARLAGLNPKRMAYILFVNNGVLAALAGCLLAFKLKSGGLDAIANGMFTGMTGAILGGVSFGGGTGGMFGAFIGMLLISGFSNGLTILGIPTWWQKFGSGALLLFALTFDTVANLIRSRSMRRKAEKKRKAEKS